MFADPNRYDLENMPTAIWVPTDGSWCHRTAEKYLPDCYQGTPLEIFQQIGLDYEPEMTAEETLVFIAEDIGLDIDAEVTLEQRAAITLACLLTQGIAREMPLES